MYYMGCIPVQNDANVNVSSFKNEDLRILDMKIWFIKESSIAPPMTDPWDLCIFPYIDPIKINPSMDR